MDYKKVYDSLCERGRTRPLSPDVYYETHHIIPKCMGGTDKKDNLTTLTYREHQLAHRLLAQIYPNVVGVVLASSLMYRMTEKQKVFLAEETKKRMVGYEATPQTRRKISEAISGDRNGTRKHGSWNKGISRNLRANTPVSKEERAALSKRMKSNNPNADGRHSSKSISVSNGIETFHFHSLTSAEKFLREHTGLVMNHASITTKMKKNLPYKGWIFTYD